MADGKIKEANMEPDQSPDYKEWAKKETFKSLVLAHLNKMTDSDWRQFRNHSRAGDLMLKVHVEDLSRSEVVDTSLACAGLSVEDVLNSSLDCHAIGLIDGHPCFYAKGAGYYFWGYPEGGFILEASATYPAYPIGW